MFLRLLGLARLDDLESMQQRHNVALRAVERLSGLQLNDNRTIARLSEDNAQLQQRVAELTTTIELMVDPPLLTADQLRTAQREAALMALLAAGEAFIQLHGHQTINNQEFPKEWHEGVAAAYEAIRALRTELEAS